MDDAKLDKFFEVLMKMPYVDFMDSLDVDKFKAAAAEEGLNVLPDWPFTTKTSEIAFGDLIFLGDPWTCWKTETQWRTDAMCRN